VAVDQRKTHTKYLYVTCTIFIILIFFNNIYLVDIIKNKFDVIDLSIKNTSNTFVNDSKVVAIIFKVSK